MTKQFIVRSDVTISQSKNVANWIIQPPQLIAFKNKKISDLTKNHFLYWLTIKAQARKLLNVNNKLIIDSVGIEFVELDTILWKKPTRVAPYKTNHLAFDFYKDQGVVIPDAVSNIKLFFDAIILDTITNKQLIHEVSFNMIRQDTTQNTPFMIQ